MARDPRYRLQDGLAWHDSCASQDDQRRELAAQDQGESGGADQCGLAGVPGPVHGAAIRRRVVLPEPVGQTVGAGQLQPGLAAANQEAALPRGCLDYRHTFGSQLAMKGESLYKIATLLGNSPEICRKHYAALLPETLADAVEFAPHIKLKVY